jgi:hypothetical protein
MRRSEASSCGEGAGGPRRLDVDADNSGQIIGEMPAREAQLVIKVMVELTRTARPSPPSNRSPDPEGPGHTMLRETND